MAIYHEDIANIELSSGQIFRSFMNHTIGSGDDMANRFGVRVFRDGEPENIGGTCVGLFIRADGTTVTISSGVVSGNVAYVTLPEACYAVEGQFSLAIKCQGSGVTGTLRIVDGVVSRTSTSAVVDPGTLVPSIEDLIDAIEDAVETIPADYTTLLAAIAPVYSTSATYAIGQYAWYDGVLYRCVVPITTGETWTSSHWMPAIVGSDVFETRKAINNSTGEIHSTVSMTQNQVVMSTTGDIFSANGYARCEKIQIPLNCKKVFFPDMYVNTAQTSAGWAIYDINTGTSTDHFVRGGQTPYIDFTEEEAQKEYYFCVSGYSDKSTWDIVYKMNDYKNPETFGVAVTVNLTAERYINYTSGNVATAPNTSYKAATEQIWIPFGCKLILFPEGRPQFNAEVGWATYSKKTGNRPDAFVRGGQSAYIVPQENERYFCFTSYNDRKTPPATTEVYFYFGNEAEIAKNLYPAYNKTICFVGDSVTFGYDDDNHGAQLPNPWVDQVGEMLKSAVYNAGYSGATVGESTATGIVVWVNRYTELANQFDIVGVMIGVNDCFNRSASYPIGTMDDNVKTTFYGALKLFWNGMVQKYPPKNGKKLFCMIYPSVYSDFPATWQPYYEALKNVAKYYAIPVLDLSECSGISPHSDPDHEYWRDNQGSYSPHLTQYGANVIAPIIADFIKNNIA